MPSELDNAIRQFRQARAQRERSTALHLRQAYLTASNSLQTQLDGMTTWMEAERAAGREVPLWRVLAEARTRNLLFQAEAAFTRYSREVGQKIQHEQRQAVMQAQTDAQELIEAGFGPGPFGVGLPFVALPHGAINQFVATTQPNAPVRKLLDEFGGQAAAAVEAELITGIASGRSPRATARQISSVLEGQYDRAFLITRTETLRAYRGAQQAIYEENAHLLEGWIWHASLSTRTCAACWAMHGTLHPVTEQMSEHPAGRCSMIPRTKSWHDLGYDVPDERPEIEPGVDVFNRLSPEQQLQTLGPKAYKAFASGQIGLADLVNVRESQTWGTTRSVGSTDGALSRAAKRTIPAIPPPPDFTKRADAESYLQERGISFFNEQNIKNLGPKATQDDVITSVANALRDVESRTGRTVRLGEVSYGKVGHDYIAKLVPRSPNDDRNHLLTINTDALFFRGKNYGFTTSTTSRDAMRHEFAHAIDADIVGEQNTREAPDGAREYTNWITNKLMTPLTDAEIAIARRVSVYADTNRAEFIAETFTGLMREESYDAAVLSMYRRHGGVIPR